MRFRKIVLALVACLVLGAFAATVVQAAGTGWTIGTTENQTTAGTLIPKGTHERVVCKKHGTSSLVLTGRILGINFEIAFEGVDCLEKAGSTNAATIDNTTSPGHSEGALTLTGAKVLAPGNCKVPGEELTTEPLTDTVIMDPSEGSTGVFDRFFPETAGGPFVTLKFENPLCVLDGVQVPVKGSVCGESVHTNAGGTGYEPNKTGTLTKVQTLLFGAAQQSTGNSAAEPCQLTLAKEPPPQLSGAVDFELASGKPFGAD